MAEQDYREKIKKLLALSESSNEHEAKSALLKAKKLMAEHKIAEIDLEDIGKKKITHIKTEFDCSKRSVDDKSIGNHRSELLLSVIQKKGVQQAGGYDILCRSRGRCGCLR